ncbi:related to integral membrane protein [Rhynchosporium agropyri]|uniref:Related to integral membrane protein n=3 Tax=Rhynchosporium TaxID=38037 RepID=A0A1E1MGZ9_RHYSE|nr:related to integral membrane protein [Rhynchosporium commune]CZS91752.1 related to integral membrane protein [Rhynchosporium agropyri]CZT48379.1 related to integral membrane protein [Rhynchosporium secalis]
MRFLKGVTTMTETTDDLSRPMSVSSTRKFKITNKWIDRACAYSGLLYTSFSFIFFIASGNFPPAAPSLTAQQTVQHYKDHNVGYKVGASFFVLSGAFYGSFTAAMSQQMKRIPGVGHSLIAAQEVSGAWACITFSVPAIFFATTAYRLDRPAEITQALNDLSWMMTFMPFAPFIVQNWAFAFAVFMDDRPKPLFPMFVGWVNFASPLLLSSGIAMHCVHRGPLAWNGALTFWLTAIVFGIQSVVNIVWTLLAIEKELE